MYKLQAMSATPSKFKAVNVLYFVTGCQHNTTYGLPEKRQFLISRCFGESARLLSSPSNPWR